MEIKLVQKRKRKGKMVSMKTKKGKKGKRK
jgi:hypothetical protein